MGCCKYINIGENMNFSEKQKKLSFALLALVFVGIYINNFIVYGESKTSFIIIAVSLLYISYKFSNNYKSKNKLPKLITREHEQIAISSLKMLPFSNASQFKSIKVARISKVTIGENWLSIILDANGQGYDFQLLGSKEEIGHYFKSLLNQNEISAVEFCYI